MQAALTAIRRGRGATPLLWSVLLALAVGDPAAVHRRAAASSQGPVQLVAPADACQASEPTASYRVAFTATWSAETHPEGFPAKPHFSDLVGATHRATWAMWRVGGFASAGIEQMAERGKTRPLAEEIETAVRAGYAGSRLSGDGMKRSPDTVTLDFQVTRAFPLVSLVSMLAPSPDWFIGVAGVNLCDGHRWVSERTAVLYAYDAGTDSGTIYEAPDLDTQPREPIRRIEWPPFTVGGKLRPVGTFTFSRR